MTLAQDRLHVAASDVNTTSRRELVAMLQAWTAAAAQMTAGRDAGSTGALGGSPLATPDDTGEALGLPPSGLTLTVGFGPSLFRDVRMLRRGYNFVDGSDGLGRLDASLFFIRYQRHPRTRFVRVQRNLARHDGLNEYLKHTSSGLFAGPRGVRRREHWSQSLFDEQMRCISRAASLVDDLTAHPLVS